MLRVAIFEGECPWHSHENEDAFSLAYEGRVVIDTEQGEIALDAGEGVVIPKGMEHKPSSESKSFVLMFELKNLASEGE